LFVVFSVFLLALWFFALLSSVFSLLAPADFLLVAWGVFVSFLSLIVACMLSARLVLGADGAFSWLRIFAVFTLSF
ncbi:FAD-dependent 2-octaprenylphenol hydroxylase, partial [Shigella sonnei]|nr:FAD-dependent 2-octaprenylphenol hydroxylase [Shigella sonnei]